MAETPKKHCIWIFGHPCSGKTYIGDYLSLLEKKENSPKWFHVDGDQGNSAKDTDKESNIYQAW